MGTGMLLVINPTLSGNEELTAVGVALSGITLTLGVAFTLARQWWRATEPGRTYEMTFVPPSTSGERKTCEAMRDDHNHIELWVRVRAKKPVITSKHSFRLVRRQLNIGPGRFWQFKRAQASQVSVCRLWDADWERRRKEDRWNLERQPSILRQDDADSWIADYGLRDAAIEETFLYRVIIEMNSTQTWRGFLQFTATGKDGRMSQTQRGVAFCPQPPGS